jgi:predicted dehydrogenase
MHTAAIIGISGYGRFHLLALLDQVLQGRLQFLAATIVNPDDEAVLCARLRSLGCEIFPSTAAMWAKFAGKIDLCFIPTGIHQHAPMTVEALKAGANVYVEKPLAGSLAEIREIQHEEKACGRFVAVGFQDTYAENTMTIKRRLLDGDFGQLKRIVVKGLWPRSSAYYKRNNWTGRLHVGGRPVFDSPANNACAHHLHIALFWAGTDLETSAEISGVQAELYRARPIESFDTCCLRAALPRDAELLAYLTHSCTEDRSPSLIIETSGARIVWSHEQSCVITRSNGQVEQQRLNGTVESRILAVDAVVARLTDKSRFISGTSQAAAHTRLIEMLHASCAVNDISPSYLQHRSTPSGDWVAIPGIENLIDQASDEAAMFSELGAPWLPKASPPLLNRQFASV